MTDLLQVLKVNNITVQTKLKQYLFTPGYVRLNYKLIRHQVTGLKPFRNGVYLCPI